ncbi:MAG TPA: acyl-CoA synthetase [Casimicrobiaceae bacterium]|nr:acyl-CoA synthetase [Casimicrobiaceae bacterium]
MSIASTPSAEWARRPERGSLPLMRLMAWVSLRFGRSVSRVPLRIIAAYYLAFGPAARRASRVFLRRVHARNPTLREQYEVFFSFASTIHDRVYFLKDRFELFDIDVQGAQVFDERGALLMGAHLGSFEAMRASGRHLGHRRVAMAMYEDNARRINAALAAIDAAAMTDVVALGRADSMLEIAELLDAGTLVGVLADRTLGREPVTHVDFLGDSAPFPTGPMRIAAALRRRVIFMVGLYRGGNRYAINFEPLADFTDFDAVPRGVRERRVEEAVAAYAKRLEHYARESPSNWFNFYDFWRCAP